MGTYFDDAAATWDDDPAKVERARLNAERLRGALPLSARDRVLEIGAGTGLLSLNLATDVGSVLVTDISEPMVAAARANIDRAGHGDRLRAKRLDLSTDDDLAALGQFTGVWTQLALHHVPDLPPLLTRVHRLLASSGWFAVIDLDADPEGAFHAHHDRFDGHHGFDRGAFADLLTAAGFADITCQDAGSIVRDLDGAGRRAFSMFLAVAYRPKRFIASQSK